MKTLYRDDEIAFGLIPTKFGRKPLLQYPHAAGILALEKISTKKIFVWLIEQYRFGCGTRSWEIPAGKKKNNESILNCAKRELAEELNFSGRFWKKLISYYPAIGISTEVLHLFSAQKLTEKCLDPDEDELITARKAFSIPEIKKMIRQKKIVDSKTMLAFSFLHNIF